MFHYFQQLLLIQQREEIFAETNSVYIDIAINFHIIECEFTLKRLQL